MSQTSDTELRELLLRRLAPERAAALEERLLVEDDCAERLLEIEHDLLDDFVAGRLDATDRAAVAQLLRDDPRDAARLRFARALRRVAAQAVDEGAKGGDAGSGAATAGAASSPRDPRPAARAPGRLPRWLGPAGVLLAAALAIVMVLPPQLSRLSRDPALPPVGGAGAPGVASTATDVSVASDAPASGAAPGDVAAGVPDGALPVPTVLLRAERARGAQARVLELDGAAPGVRLQLELPDAGAAATVSVRDARGQVTFESATLKVLEIGAYRVVEVELPRAALTPGPAVVRLQRPPAADAAPGATLFEWRVELRSP